MSTQRRAVVVGAGIAGLTSAIALERAGWRVALLERGDNLRGDGTALSLLPNGVRALRSVGLGLALDAISSPADSGTILRPDGRVLAQLAADDPERPGARTVVLRRGDLIEALVAALGDNVEIHTGVTATHVDLVHPAAGDRTRRWPADLVVGADGIDSAVRPGIDSATRTRSTGTIAFQAVIPSHRTPQLPASLRGGAQVRGADGQRFVFAAMGKHGAQWVAVVRGGVRPEKSQVRHELLTRWFGQWCDPVPSLLEVTRPDEILQQEIRYLQPLPRAFTHVTDTQGAVLVGDAAHAMTPDLGQGGAVALEDAVTLGVCLTGKTVPDGLHRYAELRYQRAVKLAKASLRMGATPPAGGKLVSSVRSGLARAMSDQRLSRGAPLGVDWTPPLPE